MTVCIKQFLLKKKSLKSELKLFLFKTITAGLKNFDKSITNFLSIFIGGDLKSKTFVVQNLKIMLFEIYLQTRV